MPSYRVHVDVAAPPERIWPLVADLTRHPSWAADQVAVTPGAGVTPAVGARYTSRATAKGRDFDADLEVTAYDEPRRFGFTARDATGAWTHTFTLAPAGAGTRITREMSGRLSPAQALLFWAALLPVKKPSARRSLDRLKSLADSAA